MVFELWELTREIPFLKEKCLYIQSIAQKQAITEKYFSTQDPLDINNVFNIKFMRKKIKGLWGRIKEFIEV